ncbi:hypothetical protein AX14_001604 [Amanita brunnescens Koide BX004]|nr:hypothetical protein AX14_001604 [Amanita brunnescens Koide BX004]
MALQYYDFFQTIELEVEYIWKTRVTMLKITYLLSKYLPYADVPLLVSTNGNWTVKQCRAMNFGVSCSFVVGIIATQLILTLRTWSLWERPRWLTCAFACYGIIIFAYGLFNLHTGLKSVQFTSGESQGWGCKTTASISVRNSQLWIMWVLGVFYDGLLCALLISRVVVKSRAGEVSRPLYIIYRDGITYYIYVFLLTTTFLLLLIGLHVCLCAFSATYKALTLV